MKNKTGSRALLFSILAVILLAGISLLRLPVKNTHNEYYVDIGRTRVYVEPAYDKSSRQTGLMFRNSLPRNTGMLFIFPEEQKLAFWMKNTYIPLDIAFIDSNFVITGIDSMLPHDETPCSSDGPARYALEVNKGFFSRHSIEEGSRVKFSESVKNIIPQAS